MSKMHNAIVRVETIAVLDAVEVAIVEFGAIFREVAAGPPLDPFRAGNLATQCAELVKNVEETRNTIRLSGESTGVH